MANVVILALLAAATSSAESSTGGTMKITWEDCGDVSTHGKVTNLLPTTLEIGSSATLTGTGTVDETISGGTFELHMKASIISQKWSGDICEPKTFKIPLGLGTVTWDGMKCPISPGTTSVPIDVKMSSSIPASLATASIAATATATSGDKLLCMNVHLAKADMLLDYPKPDGKTNINDENLIATYNSMNGATWVAGHNDFFNGMTFDDARPLLGTALTDISEHLNNTLPDSVYAAVGDVPAEFDATARWAGLIHPIRNQQHCGSCWAFSASEVLSDRVAIATGRQSPVLSPEDMVSCDKSDMGCQGGRLSTAWNYIKDTGLLTDACFPYTAGGGTAPACETKCVDGSAFTRTKATSAFSIQGVANMQKEIMTNGPIQIAFMVYKSFMSYKSGVYSKHWWELQPEGGHAVKVVGWGTESGTDYWLVANSWDTTWGLQGFFKIKRGTDECGVESRGPPYAGLPAKNSYMVV